MLRQKEIFELFTIQNNIKLDKPALNFLVSLDYDMNDLIREYKQTTSDLCINLEVIKRIINKKHNLVRYKYKFVTLLEHYTYLRSKYLEITAIKDLSQETATIFGFIYINKENELVIEDVTGTLQIKGVHYKNIFIRVTGKRSGKYFIVKENTKSVLNEQSTSVQEDDINNVCALDERLQKSVARAQEDDIITTTKCEEMRIQNSHTKNSVDKEVCTNNAKIYTLSKRQANKNRLHIDITVVKDSIIIKEQEKTIYQITEEIPQVFTFGSLKISLYSKIVLEDKKHIPVFLETQNYNFMSNINFFYYEVFDIFLVRGKTGHIEKYKDIIFVMINEKTRLHITNEAVHLFES